MRHRWVAVSCAVAAAEGAVACAGAAGSSQAGRPQVAVEVIEVRAGDLAETIEVVGSLAPKLTADLKSEYSGIVSAVHVREWVAVQKGQPLAELDTRESRATLEAVRATLMQAQVAETRAVRELQRAENLKQVGLMTQQGLEDARTAREAAAAATAAARAQLAAAETRLAKTVIRAPFDGVVAFRGVNVGDRVESMGSGEAMFRIVDPRLLDLTMAVPSSKLAAVRVTQPVEFSVDALPGRSFSGRVSFINPSVDPRSRAGNVVAHVRNDDGLLKGGLFAKGRILTGARSGVVQVPRSALQAWDVATGAAHVFVIRGAIAERRPIRTGTLSGDLVEVAAGLSPGERVATRGAFNLRPGDRVKAVGTPGS